MSDDRRDDFLRYFAPDIQRWLENVAKVEGKHPLTLVREIVREQAEDRRYVEERTA